MVNRCQVNLVSWQTLRKQLVLNLRLNSGKCLERVRDSRSRDSILITNKQQMLQFNLSIAGNLFNGLFNRLFKIVVFLLVVVEYQQDVKAERNHSAGCFPLPPPPLPLRPSSETICGFPFSIKWTHLLQFTLQERVLLFWSTFEYDGGMVCLIDSNPL